MDAVKKFRLLGPDGEPYLSDVPGTLGGNRAQRVYGTLTCGVARASLAKYGTEHRVFFADEEAAIAAGYRPCGSCMRVRYAVWVKGGEPGTAAYPWQVTPKEKRP